MNPEVKLSDAEILQLSNAGHNEIADLASGNNMLDIQKLNVASQASRDSLAKEISQIRITDATRAGLNSLLKEAKAKPSPKPPVTTEKPSEASPDVADAGARALRAITEKFEPNGTVQQDYMNWYRQYAKSWVPGNEVDRFTEIPEDAINQSRQYNKDLVKYLVAESKKPDLELSFTSWPFSDKPGIFPGVVGEKFSSIEDKQRKIAGALLDLEKTWSDADMGLGAQGWIAVLAVTFLGYRVIWRGGKAVIGSVKWFGIGSAAVSVMDAVGGVAQERAGQARGILDTAAKQREASLAARGIIDPTSADFKELFDVGERVIRGDATITDAEKARRINILSKLRGDYIASHGSGKVAERYIGQKLKAEVGYIVNGQTGLGPIGGRGIRSTIANNARNLPGVGRFFQGGLVGALNTADGLKTGSSLDPLEIMGESFEFKDATTRNNVETIWELSRQRGKLLRIQEKLTELSNQKTLETQLKTQLDATPKTIDLQTETQITTLHSTNNVANQQPATQIMKRQEVNPEYIKTLDEYNKARNAGLALTRELTTVNPNKLDQARVTNEIELKNLAIEGKLVDLRIAYPAAQILEYDRNNKGINIDKWVHRLAKNLKR